MEYPNVLKERLTELEAYHLIGTDEISDFDSLTKIAAEICQTKIALVSFGAQETQWIKSHHGIDLSETPLDASFSLHVIQESDCIFIIEDTGKDERFKENPFVTSHPHISFYAAVSLVSPRGIPLGTLSVMDDYPKKLNEIQIHKLKVLASQIIQLLELRRMHWESEKEKQAKDDQEKYRDFKERCRYLTKSGAIIWLSWTYNFAFDEGLIYGVPKDVTKLKKLQMLPDDSSKLAKVGSLGIDVPIQPKKYVRSNRNFFPTFQKECPDS